MKMWWRYCGVADRLRMVRSNQAWTTASAVATNRTWGDSPFGYFTSAGQERHEQGREDRADEIRQPATPADLRTDEPEEDATERRDHQQVQVVRLTEDPAGVVDGEGNDTHINVTRPSVTQPSAGASGIRRFIGPASRRASLPGMTE